MLRIGTAHGLARRAQPRYQKKRAKPAAKKRGRTLRSARFQPLEILEVCQRYEHTASAVLFHVTYDDGAMHVSIAEQQPSSLRQVTSMREHRSDMSSLVASVRPHGERSYIVRAVHERAGIADSVEVLGSASAALDAACTMLLGNVAALVSYNDRVAALRLAVHALPQVHD